MRIASFPQIIAATMLAIFLGLLASANEVHQRGYLRLDAQSDFAVYYTAACLLHDHLESHIYDEAGNGIDPQRQEARRGGHFLREAQTRGIAKVDLYVYPPFLAELLLPLTWLSTRVAYFTWRCISCVMILLSVSCFSRLSIGRWLSMACIPLLVGLLCFSPIWQALHYGQITLVLLGLISSGVVLYQCGWKTASATVLATAALIKLTPLILLLPMLLWRDWRWVRWFGTALLAGLVLSNGPHSPRLIQGFFVSVLPSMSAGVISRENQTILSAVQMLWCHGRNTEGLVAPGEIVLLGGMLSMLLLIAGALALWLRRSTLASDCRPEVLFSFVLLSLCSAPVAWIDTLVFGFPLLVLIWARILPNRVSLSKLLFIFACSVGMGCSLAIKSVTWLSSIILFQYLPMLSAISLAMYSLLSVRESLNRMQTSDSND